MNFGRSGLLPPRPRLDPREDPMAILTVISKALHPTTVAASAVLRHIIDDPLNVVEVIVGNTADTPNIVAIGVGRASAYPDLRCVVQVLEPDAIDPADLAEIQGPQADAIAAFYGLKDKVAERLDATDAEDKFEVEKAFLKAQQQK